MITFKSRDGRLGEVMHLIYGLFYFCIRNDIPLESIVIDKNYTGKPYDSDKRDYVIKDNWPMFDNIKGFIKDCGDFPTFLLENQFKEIRNGMSMFKKPVQLDLSKNYILSDYWHFPYNRKLFHALFKVPRLVQELREKHPDIDFSNACSCHIRRGDFKYIESNPKMKSMYPDKIPPSAKTVRNKMKDFWIEHPNSQMVVFSDDIKWCKKNLNAKKVVFMGGNKPYEDINLIGMCKEHLQFNSSYFNYVGMMLGD